MRRLGPLLLVLSCTQEVPPELVDQDEDGIPDLSEDRNQNGNIDPGETDPEASDTDGDGIPDEQEVSTQACGAGNDRPFAVYDVPGAYSALLVDAKVSQHALLFTTDQKNPGGVFYDPELDVAALLISKRGFQPNVRPEQQRDHERTTSFARLGRATVQRTRAFTTAQGYAAETATLELRASQPTSAAEAANLLAQAIMGGVPLTGTLSTNGPTDDTLQVHLLTVLRESNRVVILAAIAAGEVSPAAQLRLEELADGTNVARRDSFTRHVCDPFVAQKRAAADILWVIDDSGSMEDDQQAVRSAAAAMGDVLEAAQVEYRLGVVRMRAPERNDPRRGQLEGNGLTEDLLEFQRRVVVGAEGGWEPGLETGILALDRLLPRSPPGQTDPGKLRDDAATIVIHLSDERDQEVECLACGACDGAEGEQRFCSSSDNGRAIIDRYVAGYQERGAVTFAIVGDLPNGCQQTSTRDDFEPGQGYVEVANGTGGQFGSLCGDMRQNLEDVARVATSVASTYQLSAAPASATIKVVVGLPGQGRAVPRDRQNGFDYDPARNTIVFYGAARPKENEEVVVGYRRWDYANNPLSPPDGCDECENGSSCDPTLDIVDCGTPCGGAECAPGLICLPDTAACGDPTQVPPADGCGGCDAGLVCNERQQECVTPCEQTGCGRDELCNSVTHLCERPDL